MSNQYFNDYYRSKSIFYRKVSDIPFKEVNKEHINLKLKDKYYIY